MDKPTRIMYAANLSWKPTQRIFSKLMEQGLITELKSTENKKSRLRYKITKRGLTVLDYFDEARKILPFEEVYKQD